MVKANISAFGNGTMIAESSNIPTKGNTYLCIDGDSITNDTLTGYITVNGVQKTINSNRRVVFDISGAFL